MMTKLIGIKEFRANVADYAKKAQKGNVKYIVMNRNKPLFEIKPFKKNSNLEDLLLAELEEASADVRSGRFYTEEEILEEFSK